MSLTGQEIVERAVPAHMLVLLIEALESRKVFSMRADVKVGLERGLAVLFKGADPLCVRVLAQKVDDHARGLLGELSTDDLRPALLATSNFTLRLVDEGLHGDPGDQAVLTSLLILEEAKFDPQWEFHEVRASVAGSKLLSKARLLGLYGALLLH